MLLRYSQWILLTVLISISSLTYADSHYRMTVNLKNQNVEVFQDGQHIKTLACSTGFIPGSTPVGEFETYSRKGEDFWIEEAEGVTVKYYYLTRFNKNIAFHSLIEGDHPFVAEGKELFAQGKPSSLGCVRMSKEDAKWIYDLPLGIPVQVVAG